MYIQIYDYSHIVKVNFVFVRRIYCMFFGRYVVTDTFREKWCAEKKCKLKIPIGETFIYLNVWSLNIKFSAVFSLVPIYAG